MTWGKAAFVLALCVVFDALSAFFGAFWLTGPLLGIGLCVGTVQGVAGEYVGVVTSAGACTVLVKGLQIAADFFTLGGASAAMMTFGAVMAMLVGFLAWGTVGFLLVLTNRRVFKENFGQILWLVGGLAIDQIPIVNTIPALTPVVWKLYRAQIKKEKSALAAYERQKAEIEAQERMAQVEEYMEMVRMQAEQARAEQDRNDFQSPEMVPQAA